MPERDGSAETTWTGVTIEVELDTHGASPVEPARAAADRACAEHGRRAHVLLALAILLALIGAPLASPPFGSWLVRACQSIVPSVACHERLAPAEKTASPTAASLGASP